MGKINIFYLVPTLEVGGSEWMVYLLAKGLNRERCLKEFSSNVLIRKIEDLYGSLLNEKRC